MLSKDMFTSQRQLFTSWKPTLIAILGFLGVLSLIFLFNISQGSLVTIDSTVDATSAQHNGSSPTTVFTDENTGYAFYVDSTNTCVYRKTTDGGNTWGATVTVDSQVDCIMPAVWYDRWTPGNATGTIIHIATIDAGEDDIWYATLDTSNDSLTSPINITSGSGYVGVLANGGNVASITRGSDGALYASLADASDNIVVRCTTTCTTATNWSETSPSSFTAGDDATLLVPLLSGSVLLIWWDVSLTTNDIKSRLYTSGSGWDAGWTNIATALDNTTYDAMYGADVDKSTGNVYLAYGADVATIDTTDDVRTARYNYASSTWTLRTDAVTNGVCAGGNTCGVIGAKIAYEQTTDDVYVVYSARSTSGTGTTGNVYWKVSTDDMSTWGSEQGPLRTTDSDIYGARVSFGDRFYATFIAPSQIFGETIFAPTVTVSATGTQATPLSIGDPDQYTGGGFVFTRDVGTTTVTSITLTETGTVDAANLHDVDLFYEYDNTAPYNCAGESYAGTESQYGSTVSEFNAADGVAVFTDNLTVSPTQAACVYTALTVGALVTDTQNFELQITNAATDVSVASGFIGPSSTIAISGTSAFFGGVITQARYHWRNDDGSETTATSKTGGIEDTPIANVLKNDPVRLRFGVANTDNTSYVYQYRLEYGEKTSICSDITNWVTVGSGGSSWRMSNSANLTNGADTTNIATSTGGITDFASTTFKTTNGGVRDATSTTGSITLASQEFLELEYSIEAADLATFGQTYCFRLTNAGTAIQSYNSYPEATIRADNDFFVQRGLTAVTGTSVTITAGVDYTAPASADRAFIRITNTQLTGAGKDGAGGSQNASNVSVYIVDPSNLEQSVTFSRIGSTNNTFVAWEIVEYIGPQDGDNEFIVRDANTLSIANGVTSSSGSSVAGVVDDSDIAVFITGQRNPDTSTTNTNNYNTLLTTSNWNAGSDLPTFQRGEGTLQSDISYAVVEFTGKNWKIQRIEHSYSNTNVTENQGITAVNDLSRAFLHVQKRVGNNLNYIAEFGQEVWLSGVGTISFFLQSGARTAASHVAVVWVIENTQTSGRPMVVTRTNGTQTGALVTEPIIVDVAIGTTLADLSNASIFANNRVSGTAVYTYPQPIMAVYIASSTHYRLWISEATTQTRTYRTEVVEWPSAARNYAQNYYRFYVDNGSLTPTDAWPLGGTDLGENTTISGSNVPPAPGDVVRLRMSVTVSGSALSEGSVGFKLQYGERTSTCSAIGDWHDVGDISSTTALWRGYNNTPSDGVELSGDPPTGGDLLLSVSDRAGTYEEENISSLNPYRVAIGEDVEYDWTLQHNDAPDQTYYCFRMVEDDGTSFETYQYYPTLITAGFVLQSEDWRWYEDETSLTPSSPLALENSAPVDVAFDNIVKLRVLARETAGKAGQNVKLKLQFSQASDFSGTSTDVAEIGSCTDGASLWCYADGAGVDNALIDSKVLANTPACSGGSGAGCGTHNESGTSTSSYTHEDLTASEYEFTLRHAGARANGVYFFRLYDVTNNRPATTTGAYPSLVTAGAALTFSINGVASSTTLEGVTTNVGTGANGINFGSVPLNTDWSAAHQLNVSTNATGGYRIFVYERQGLQKTASTTIADILGTNATPTAWSSTGCLATASGCFGYHTSDGVLSSGNTTRFAADDSYAAFDGTAREVAYNAGPVTLETTNIIYKVMARITQAAGNYSGSLVYLIVPMF